MWAEVSERILSNFERLIRSIIRPCIREKRAQLNCSPVAYRLDLIKLMTAKMKEYIHMSDYDRRVDVFNNIGR